jgi:transporter family protein
MDWFFIAILVAFLGGSETLVNRFVLKKEEDSDAYAFAFQIIASILLLPLFILGWQPPTETIGWVFALGTSVVWTLIALIGFRAHRFADVSLKTPLGKSKVFWAIFFAAIILSEAVTTEKILGSILIFVGVVVATIKLKEKFGGLGDPGVKLTLIMALLAGLVAVLDKISMGFFQPQVYGFIEYLLPTILIGLFIPYRFDRVKSLVGKHGKWLVLAVLFNISGYLLMLYLYKSVEVSLLTPIFESSIIFAFIGGIIFLGERKDLVRRAIGGILIIIGVLIIKGVIGV